jgi:hypothetical protein
MLVDDGSVTSVAQLLALHDRSFIHASYQSLLGRLPDAEGEAYYLARLRAGVHKLAILRQIRSSAEGSTFVPVLDGLDRTLSRYRWAMLPLVGYLFRLVWRVDGNGHTPQALRAITNNIARISSELARRQAEQAALATAVQELAARPLGMPTVPVAQPEPFIDEPRGEDSAAELTIPGVEHLGRDASRILGLMAKSMHKQKHCRVAVDASRN